MQILFFHSLDNWDLDEDGLKALADSAIKTALDIEDMAESIQSGGSFSIDCPPLRDDFYCNLGIGFIAWILDLPFPPQIGYTFRASVNGPDVESKITTRASF
jgi:hypothetical protein